jgi:hypothetical protein
MAGTPHSKLQTSPLTRKKLRSQPDKVRQLCRERWQMLLNEAREKCAQTPVRTKIASDLRGRLDWQAAMLQAIRIGREIPMLEPWIIDEIRRREEERRRGDLPRLEIPMPQPAWPDEYDPERVGEQQDDQSTERGVVIIGM